MANTNKNKKSGSKKEKKYKENRNTNQFLEEDGVYSGAAEVAEELTPSHHGR